MKKSMFIASALCCLAAVDVFAADWTNNLFETRSHNFGTVARAAKTEFSFEFTNHTNQAIHISHVRASCGCTTPIVPEKTIAPGAKGEVIARLNTGSFLGQRGATLTVVFDQPQYREVQLRVDGYVRRDVVCNPGSLDFGKVQKSAKISKSIDIQYAGRDDWKIEDIQSDLEGVEFDLKETRRGNGRVGYTLVAEWDAAEVGYVQSELTLRTNDRRRPEIPLEVSAQVVSAVQVSPANLYLGASAAGQTIKKRVILKSDSPFAIVSANCEDKRVNATFAEGEKPLQIVDVTFTAEGDAGEFNLPLVIKTTAGQQEEVTVAISGTVDTQTVANGTEENQVARP